MKQLNLPNIDKHIAPRERARHHLEALKRILQGEINQPTR